MESLRLTDQEQKFYADLFSKCDVENSGEISYHAGADRLFISSGLSHELLNQIVEACGAKELGHMRQGQFYIALKLIAAAQSGLSVTFESLNSGQELPLPIFGAVPQGNMLIHNGDSNLRLETSSISSEADSVEDVWAITEEQRDYYINQFKLMQPDVRGVISGVVAKEFFEKSKLPVPELSKIWQLSDVNRDGALSLEEFCTAMHLVVLRRNEIELPDNLPLSLIPCIPLNSDGYGVDFQGGSSFKISPGPPSPGQWISAFSQPQDSRTSSSVSSVGSKPTPVNFDYKPITADPESKIVHPVALRMSPDGLAVTSSEDSDQLVSLPPIPAPAVPARTGLGFKEENSVQNIEEILFGDAEDMERERKETDDSKTPPVVLRDRPRSHNAFEFEPVVMITSTPAKGLVSQSSSDHEDLKDSIRKQRLKNMTLSRLNNELNQELQEVMEQRIGLEIQLEHLRPFHS